MRDTFSYCSRGPTPARLSHCDHTPRRSRWRARPRAAACVIGVLMQVTCGGSEQGSDARPEEAPSSPTVVETSAPAGALASTPQAARGSAESRSVRAFTGSRTRVVWVQGDGTDPYAAGDALQLMGLDTDEGSGERVILRERRSYVKPMFTSGGERIVFSRRPTAPGGARAFVVNWDGSSLRELAAGFALTVWQNPSDGRDWVYLGTDPPKDSAYDFHTVVRFPLDQPEAREQVWNRTLVSGDTFQVSADGRAAGGLFPWPKAGVADLVKGELQTMGEGCWTALRDAGNRLFWYFDGAHRNLLMVDVSANRRWTVPINQAPGFEDPEVYHPRWTNHPRFLAMSGPYNQGGPNQVRSGGKQSEIYLGRFSRDYSRVDEWARVTTNGGGDSYPDVWIDRTGSPHPVEIAPPSQQATSEGTAPGRVVVEARLASAMDIPAPRSLAPYRHALVVNVYDVVKVLEGQYEHPQVRAAQWAIRDMQILPEARARQTGTVARLVLERYDARPELEGERLIAPGGVSRLPLYYDVESLR